MQSDFHSSDSHTTRRLFHITRLFEHPYLKGRAILKGTIILTAVGFLTRFMGFFYRIFLSHTFGEEGVGLYQLVFPVFALCFSLTSAGVQSALARCVAKNERKSDMLYTSLWICVPSSCIVMVLLQRYASVLADQFLKEPRCAQYLILMSYALPFAAVHSCVCGYCLGLKSTRIPAFSQLLEQFVRITSVFLLYQIGLKHGIRFGISIAVAGLLFGEAASGLYGIWSLRRQIRLSRASFSCAAELLSLSLPLTASRILLNLLQSLEAVSIPQKLMLFGAGRTDALAAYGILTGMALPCVLFPSAITNSLCTMLLPSVAQAQARQKHTALTGLVRKSILSCMALGVICFATLFLFGPFIGRYLFHSRAAGGYIRVLSWICPFLYVNSACVSIINGVGKTTVSFLINLSGLAVRLLSVWYLIPVLGMYGYFLGLLVSQIGIFFGAFSYLRHRIVQTTSSS